MNSIDQNENSTDNIKEKSNRSNVIDMKLSKYIEKLFNKQILDEFYSISNVEARIKLIQYLKLTKKY